MPLVTLEDEFSVGLDELGRVRISPTDVSQFIRLDQCERYLRLRLHERSAGMRFMHDYGVVPQSIPPLLTQSGALFEEGVERTVAARFRTINLALQVADGLDIPDSRPTDNERVVAQARDLAAGETLVLFQPRLLVALGSWDVRGDIDILRLARDASGALQILIADIKSSTAAKVEHRLQVAFYAEMVAALLAERRDRRRSGSDGPRHPLPRTDRRRAPPRRRVTATAGSWSARGPAISSAWRMGCWSWSPMPRPTAARCGTSSPASVPRRAASSTNRSRPFPST